MAGSRLYTDSGGVHNAENGTHLNHLYLSGSIVAVGSVAIDSTLGRAFMLDSTQGSYSTADQVQVFNLADDSALPLAVPATFLPAEPRE